MYQISNVDFEEIISHLQEFAQLSYQQRRLGTEDHQLINRGRRAAALASKLKRKQKISDKDN